MSNINNTNIMKKKFNVTLIKKFILNILKSLVLLIQLLFAILSIMDIFTTPLEINFPFEAGGFFYSSKEIYIVSGLVIGIINLLPLLFIMKKLRHNLTKIILIVLLFDLLYAGMQLVITLITDYY